MTAASRSGRCGLRAGSRVLRRRSAGIATIEFAIIAVVAILIMQFCWWAGRAYWQRSLLEAATRDGAQLIAITPPGEMASAAAINAVQSQAEALIEDVAQRNGFSFVDMVMFCDGSGICGSAAGLKIIRVEVQGVLPESVFPVFGGDGIVVNVAVEVPYGGRFAFQ